jgi:hypothetical protein
MQREDEMVKRDLIRVTFEFTDEVLEKQSFVQRQTMGFELCIHLKTNFEKRITSCVCRSGVRINNGMSAE